MMATQTDCIYLTVTWRKQRRHDEMMERIRIDNEVRMMFPGQLCGCRAGFKREECGVDSTGESTLRAVDLFAMWVGRRAKDRGDTCRSLNP